MIMSWGVIKRRVRVQDWRRPEVEDIMMQERTCERCGEGVAEAKAVAKAASGLALMMTRGVTMPRGRMVVHPSLWSVFEGLLHLICVMSGIDRLVGQPCVGMWWDVGPVEGAHVDGHVRRMVRVVDGIHSRHFRQRCVDHIIGGEMRIHGGGHDTSRHRTRSLSRGARTMTRG